MIVCGLSMGARLTSSSPLQRFERDVRYRLACRPEEVADELKYMADRQQGGGGRGRWSTSLDGPARPRPSTMPTGSGARYSTSVGSVEPQWAQSDFDGSSPRSGSPDSLEPEEEAELDHFNRFCRLKPGHATNPLWTGQRTAGGRRSPRHSPRRLPSFGSRPATRERPSTRESAFSVQTSASFAGGSELPSTRAETPDTTFWPEVGDRAALPNTLAVTESVRVAHLEATRARTASELGRRPSSGSRAAQHWASSAPSPLERRGTRSWWVHLGKDRTGKAGSEMAAVGSSLRPEHSYSNPDIRPAYNAGGPSSVGSGHAPASAGGVEIDMDGYPVSTGTAGRQRKPGGGRRPPRSTEGVLSGGSGDLQALSSWGSLEPNAAEKSGLRAWTPE